MLVRIKRIKTGKKHNPTTLDNEFRKASITRLPQPGDSQLVLTLPDPMNGNYYWHTTEIRTISFRLGYMKIRTHNSLYHLKLGWGK